MSKLAFTLIELIIVVIIISIVSFLIIKLPSFSSSSNNSIIDLRKILYPNGSFYLFDNGDELVIKNDKNLTIHLNFTTPEVLIYNGSYFKKKDFGYLNNKKIIFEYNVKNGIGDSFILINSNDYYVFKPFEIKKFKSLDDAKNYFLLKKYQPTIGEYY